MVMITKKSRSAIIVILAALLMGGLSSAAWTFQDQKRVPTSEEEKKRALDELAKKLQDSQAGKPAPAPSAQPPQPQPAPIPPTPTSASSPAISPAPRESGKVLLNMENADLYDFINQISSTLNLTPLVIDPDVKGTVNLSSGPISKDDILPLFNLILKNNNAALIRQNGTYQVVPISSALKRGVEIIDHLPAKPEMETAPLPGPETGNRPADTNSQASVLAAFKTAATQIAAKSNPMAAAPTGKQNEISKDNRLATHVIRVDFVPVKDLIEPVKLFMTEGGVIMPYERLNMLILTDYADSIERILQIVHMLDNNYLDPDLVELVKINNNASADVAEDLRKIFGTGGKDAATGVSFISLDRLNALFVLASSKRALGEVKGWIKQLDSASAKNIQTFVYEVQNSTASDIAMMLTALYGGEGSGGTSGTSSTGAGSVNNRPQGSQGSQGMFGSGTSGAGSSTFGSQASSLQTSQYGGYGSGSSGGFGGLGGSGGGAFGAGRQLGPQLNPNRTVSAQVLRGGQLAGLQDTVHLVVDDINNSLIIMATSVDYAYISETIRKMDVLPRQALIDAKIFEVDLEDDKSYGLNSVLQPKGTATSTLTTGSINSGTFSAQTYMPIGDARELLATLNAVSTKTKVKVLEAPSVLALDGQMASIMVGSQIPYPAGSFTPSVGGSTTSVEYRDTGINLQVVPRISASGSVTLDLVQEVSAPGADVTVGGGSAPTFTVTTVSTTLTVKDGETVAIAGLIRDGDNFSRTGVPFLSQIPLLGSLFGQTTRNAHRNELIIMITPHVIRTPEKLQEMTQELRDKLRNDRKWVDEKEKETTKDMEKAQADRSHQEQKTVKKSQPAESVNPEKKEKPQQTN